METYIVYCRCKNRRDYLIVIKRYLKTTRSVSVPFIPIRNVGLDKEGEPQTVFLKRSIYFLFNFSNY